MPGLIAGKMEQEILQNRFFDRSRECLVIDLGRLFLQKRVCEDLNRLGKSQIEILDVFPDQLFFQFFLIFDDSALDLVVGQSLGMTILFGSPADKKVKQFPIGKGS